LTAGVGHDRSPARRLSAGPGDGIGAFCFFRVGHGKIGKSFFNRDVNIVARELIETMFVVDGVGGVIVETESYDASDPASHSLGMRRVEWTATMFGPPSHAHLCKVYGLHWCLNFVRRVTSAVLIRAMEPKHGIERMHGNRHNKMPLVSELVESMRSAVDQAILGFVLSQTFHPGDFAINRLGGCRLNPQLAKVAASRLTHQPRSER
jgi:hypothetical protein